MATFRTGLPRTSNCRGYPGEIIFFGIVHPGCKLLDLALTSASLCSGPCAASTGPHETAPAMRLGLLLFL